MTNFIYFAVVSLMLICNVICENRESIVCESFWDISPSKCCPLPPPNLTKKQQEIYKQALEEFHTLKNGCKSWLPYFRHSLKVYRENGDVSISAIKTIFAKSISEKFWNKIVDNSIRTCVQKSECHFHIYIFVSQ